ncbi:hypothetical protein Pint_20216 [Pistacia integerrima]|uniref:Uncharacterized protein n=1 Tax=Pistacia integerrima TaxID=434235 RepID=A0ACC0XEP4_9ROSI|nr:hypothetical protein Pint_20216 [Pistacia integerrima]
MVSEPGAMEHRMESLAKEVSTLAAEQEKLIERMTKLFATWPSKWETQAILREQGETSQSRNNRVHSNSSTNAGTSINSGAPELVKLDFPRFNGGEDPTSWLCRQFGSVKEYQTQFERLLSRAGQVTSQQQVSCFISGLRDNLQADVRAGNPITLEVQALAPLHTPLASPVKRTMPEEVKERRDKGLCFRYNERYSPGHQCKRLFVIEACWPEDEDNDGEGPLEVEGDSESMPEISFNAIFRAYTPQTMRLKGTLFSLPVHILVDSGSAHNFISNSLAAKVGLHPREGRSFEVAVASGERLTSPGQCNRVALHTQGIPLQLGFYLFPLDAYEIILCTQWLRTLGPHYQGLFPASKAFHSFGKKGMFVGLSIFTR